MLWKNVHVYTRQVVAGHWVLPAWVTPGVGWSLRYLCLCLLPPPFPPSPPGTSSALPLSECTHTPYFLGKWKWLAGLCHFPHTPGGRSRDQPGSLPCNCWPSGPDRRDAALQGRVQELSAHHVIAIHSIGGILHWVIDFPTECWQVLGEPVSVFRQKIPLDAFHQIFKTQVHGLLFLWWLAIDDAVS